MGAALLSAVSTLMFNQLRELLTNSIDAFVAFLGRYGQSVEVAVYPVWRPRPIGVPGPPEGSARS